MYQQYQNQSQQSPLGNVYNNRPPKPRSTKIDGFLLMHFSGIIQLTTQEEKPDGFVEITLYLLCPFLNTSASIHSLSNPEDYGDIVAPFNIKLKVSSPEILKPKSGLQIREKVRPYAFIAAIKPDAVGSNGNLFGYWRGHLVAIGDSFESPEMRKALHLPGMGKQQQATQPT